MAKQTAQDMADDVARLLHARYGIGKTNLSSALKRAKRQLPRKFRKQADVIIKAESLTAVPKLARQVDMGRVQIAHRLCVAHLQNVGAAERRKDFFLGVFASVSLALIVIFALAVWILR